MHTDRSLYNFITRLQTLATRIGLDLVHCADFAKLLEGTKSEVLHWFDPIAHTSFVRSPLFASSNVIEEMESEVQLKRTSQMLRKYHSSREYDGDRGDVISKAELLPGDWLILLHRFVTPNDPPRTFRPTTLPPDQGLYGIYREGPLSVASGVDWRDWLVDYCVLVRSSELNTSSWYERAAYEFFDNEDPYAQDKVSAMTRSQDKFDIWRKLRIYIPMSEILKISTFERYVHSAASQPVSRIDWREVKTIGSPGIRIVLD